MPMFHMAAIAQGRDFAPEVLILGSGQEFVAIGRREPGPEGHQFVRLFIGKRSKKDRIDDAEDRGVGSDSEGQSKRSYCGKAGAPKQGSEGVAEVLKQGAHLIHSEGVVRGQWRTARQIS